MINKLLNKLLIVFLQLISFLPLSLLYLLAYLLYILLYKVVRYRDSVVKLNLQNSFPTYTNEHRLKIEKEYYHYLSSLIVETLKSFTISKKDIIKRMTLTNKEVLEELYENQQNAIVVLGHYANWEFLCKGGALQIPNQIITAYKPLSNPYFDKLMYNSRTKYGTQLVAMNNVPRALRSAQKPYLLVLVADQSPSHLEQCEWVNFLNQETAILPGTEKLAIKYNLPVYFANIQPARKGYYTCTFEKICSPPYSVDSNITKLHVEKLQEIIVSNPSYWLWSHRRWKHNRK